jgi:hypothetical protein
MSSPAAPTTTFSPVANPEDPTSFEGIPDPRAFLRDGGRPGVAYAYVLGAKASEDGYEMAQGIPVLTFTQDGKRCENILVVCKGVPIDGANPANGVRQWGVSTSILVELGLAEPAPKPPKATEPKATKPTAPKE